MLPAVLIFVISFASACIPGSRFSEEFQSCLFPVVTRRPWFSAERYCIQLGGHLVSIKSKAQNLAVKQFAKENFGHTIYWIGLDSHSEWSDGSKVTYSDYAIWLPIVFGRHCVYANTRRGTWRRGDCINVKSQSVCEIPPTNNCEDGWTYYNRFCYKAFKNQNITQSEAKSACSSYEASLASIHSYNENQFIFSLAAQNFGPSIPPEESSMTWIGGYVIHSYANRTYWLDDTSMNYYNYAVGEPDNLEGKENCLQMYTNTNIASERVGKWNDCRCDLNMFGYVCKKTSQ